MPQPALSDGLSLRSAVAADAPVIADIYNETVLARLVTFDLEPKPAEYFAGLIAAVRHDEAFLVLEDTAAGEPDLPGPRPALLGFGRLFRYSDREGYRHTAETSVYLWRRLARRGYGTLLKQAVIDRARELGYHHLVAKITTDNTASIAYNRRFGYTDVGVQREVGWVDGAWRDVLIMQLILPHFRGSGDWPRF
jgi:phosphinothricin acetyltransferase